MNKILSKIIKTIGILLIFLGLYFIIKTIITPSGGGHQIYGRDAGKVIVVILALYSIITGLGYFLYKRWGALLGIFIFIYGILALFSHVHLKGIIYGVMACIISILPFVNWKYLKNW